MCQPDETVIMPRFYFDVHDGTTVIIDRLGIDCADQTEAQREAMLVAGDACIEKTETGWTGGPWRMEIRDQRGAPVATLTFRGS